jgi:tetrapyrrole methylase family protein/MazG family protein
MKDSYPADKFVELLRIMERLRGERGCPWDLKQTHESLVKYLIEESYEFSEAVAAKDDESMAEELGDVMLQIVFHAQIASEEKRFTISDVLDKICAKMRRRHPHVFGDATAETAEDVLRRWESDKQNEKEDRKSILEGIPKTLPALMRAQRMQDRAAYVGFDWEHFEEVLDKFEEEWREFRQAYRQNNRKAVQSELGDLFFALVNICRFLEIDAEQCAAMTVDKFSSRFHYIEQKIKEQGGTLEGSTLQEMDRLWEEAKKGEKED